MLRAQQFLLPAIFLSCLTVVLITRFLFQPGKPAANPGSKESASLFSDSGILAIFNLHTTIEDSKPARSTPKPAAKAKPKSNQSKSVVKNASVKTGSQADSSSGCPLADSYPNAVRQWCSLIESNAQAQNLDPNLVAAVILQESGGDPQAYSSSGAVGLMQVMPRDGLAAGFTCGSAPCFASRPAMDELYDPEFNISYGTRMLASLVGRYGSLRDALMAYGPANVGYYYADIVLGIYERYN